MTRLVDDDVYRRLCRARDYLHERHAEPLAVADSARQAGMSRFHFLRRFDEAFGTTPRQYLMRVRLERAKALLAGDRGTVTDVCFDVGFSSLGSFSTMFAERVGCPPSAWRRRVWQVAREPLGIAQLHVPWCFWTRRGSI